MNRSIATLCVFVAALIPATFASDIKPNADTRLTPSQARRLAHTAVSADQFDALANYYAARQRMFRQKEGEEMGLWVVRAPKFGSLNEKWPRPIDSVRSLYEYYQYEARRCGKLSQKYNEEAAAAK